MVNNGIRPVFEKLLLTERTVSTLNLNGSRVPRDMYADNVKKDFETIYLDIIHEFSDRGVHLTQGEVDSIHPALATRSPLYMQTLRSCCK